MNNFKIIGIGGTNGSGKDTVGEMLAERHGWLVISISDFLREEARRRNLPIERKHLSSISAEWRRKHGHGVLTERATELFKKVAHKHPGLAVIPLRHPGEATKVKELRGTVVWVDADPKIRYQRIFGRMRSAEDDKNYREFLADEKREMHHEGDAATLSMSKVKSMAEIFLENNGNNIEAFKDQAEKTLAKLL